MKYRGVEDDPWVRLSPMKSIPRRGAGVVLTPAGSIAVFRTADDRVFALDDRCPHQGGPLSEGLVHGCQVTCPLHGRDICLMSGRSSEPADAQVRVHPVRVEAGEIYLAVQDTWPYGVG
jgi:nitrite reductase (NADH) small subunit